ncbi:polysaccharide deacetylase family protein [Streptomyces viridochromogenes]|uniref:polysaccharide deacetylase family protein n=1 Tax=Streptomyces viridochromogenes TaxID=1938 RepID=UPI00069CE287|nr:polysaccharide deacetylase family protein [Streptomyces viridochromogenes]
MHQRTTATTATSLALAGVLALTTGCSSGTDSSPTAGSGADKAAAATSSASSGGTAKGGIDPSRIKGLQIVNDSSEDSSCPWATSYPAVPGADAMTAAMKREVDRNRQSFLGEDGSGTAECGGTSQDQDLDQHLQLNISHDFLVASGDVLGVRLNTLRIGEAGDGLMTTTYWFDGKAKQRRQALDLVAEGSRAQFVAAVKKALKNREGIDPSMLDGAFADSESQYGALDDLAFTSDGGLRIEFDSGMVGVPAGGRYKVTLPKATVTPWLSDFGRRVQQQTTDPAGTLDLGAASTPTEPAAPTIKHPGEDDTDCSKVKCIALTFDDGPAATETSQLLTYLAKYKARATFFTVGQNVAAHPDLVRAEAAAGHEVGNHSWSHPDLTGLSTAQIQSQLSRTSAAIKAATGEEPKLFRPPYGAINSTVRAATTLSPVLWDVDTEDWKYRDSGKVAQTVITKAGRNEVVLMHDIHPTSVGAVPEILRTLTARGYHFVTVSQLRATL